MVEVRLNDIGAAGKVIDAATKSGANQMQGVNFALRDEQKLRADALAKAAVQARANVNALAASLGQRVTRILRIEDGEPVRVVPLRAEMMMRIGRRGPNARGTRGHRGSRHGHAHGRDRSSMIVDSITGMWHSGSG